MSERGRDEKGSSRRPGDARDAVDAEGPPSQPVPKLDGALGRAMERPRRASRQMRRAPGDDLEELSLPSHERLLEAVLTLARPVLTDLDDAGIVERFLAALAELFPRRLFAVRVAGASPGDLARAWADAPLARDATDAIEIPGEALARGDLADVDLSPSVRVTEAYVPVFGGDAAGFCVPVVRGGQVCGALFVEYRTGQREPEGERALLTQLGMHLGATLRHAQVVRASQRLGDYAQKLLDHANAPILVLTPALEIRVANRAFTTLTGHQAEDLVGRDFTSLLAEEDRALVRPVLLATARGESSTIHEARLQRLGPGVARIAFNTAPVAGVDDAVESIIAIGQDLTQFRELEEQVIQAEKLATLGQLAAGVVHELNNPLTSISVYSEYLLKKLERSGAEASDVEKLRRVVESAERILRFTRDLVTYARPTSEEPRLLDLHEVLDQAIVFCEHVITKAGARLDRRYATELPLVYGVKGQLHQVFINLLTNACQAVKGGSGQLRIETCASGTDVVEVRVSDDGAGIPRDIADRIFEPFFSTKSEGRGTGLGLSIVRNIVDHHRGEISVQSELGVGTTFTVRLPQP